MIIGFPLGLFATVIFVLSVLLGHLFTALLLVYYFRHKTEKTWGFWNVTFLTLLYAIALRLVTIVPFVGILLSLVILSITYGTFTLKVIDSKKQVAKT